MDSNIVLYLDYLGTAIFAISGALAGINRKFDPFGIFILGMVTAIGGGTLRDSMLGISPVGWLTDTNFLYVILIGVMIAVVFRNHLNRVSKIIFIVDAIGLGLFTVTGINLSLEAGLAPGVCIILGTISAVFGGVIRDTLSNEIPLIFHKEIYASISLAGGGVYFCLLQLGIAQTWAFLVVCVIVIVLRICAVRYSWTLPIPND